MSVVTKSDLNLLDMVAESLDMGHYYNNKFKELVVKLKLDHEKTQVKDGPIMGAYGKVDIWRNGTIIGHQG